MGNASRVFENTRLTVPVGSRTRGSPDVDTGTHSGMGPGICAPYLSMLGWLDPIKNANQISWSGHGLESWYPYGDLTGSIYANQGGLPVDSPKRTVLIISIVTSLPPHNTSEYWIEYRIPQGFDEKIFEPPGDKKYAPGALLLREVDLSHSYYFYWTPITIDSRLRLPKLAWLIRITGFNESTQEVSYILEQV